MGIVWLSDLDAKDINIAGGKGANLGEMLRNEIPVPNGFVVDSLTYKEFIEKAGLKDKIQSLLEFNVNDSAVLKERSAEIRELIEQAKIPANIQKEIEKAYEQLCKQEGEEVFVAIRSSATAEDLPEASFAGQQDTYLNIKGKKNVVKYVKKCWSSLYTSRAIFYRAQQNFDLGSVSIAVVVQKMVNAEKSGVMFTSHPVTGKKLAIIEATWGLGEALVSGKVSPDTYIFDRDNKKLIEKKLGTKSIMITRDPETGESIEKEVDNSLRESFALTEEEIQKLVSIGEVIEDLYGHPQDVEWAIERGEIYIVQSRAITTIKGEMEKPTPSEGEVLLKGLGASPGMATGEVKILNDASRLDKVQEGDILVTKMTTPDMVPAMKRAGAIVTDEGGLTCHAAIVSRELGTPAVVGTKKATTLLKDNMVITVDGERGVVYRGTVKTEEAKEERVRDLVTAYSPIITATDVKVNVSIPEAAKRAAETGADGVGLLRIEHVILGLKKHPMKYIEDGEEEEYIKELAQAIQTVAEAFYPKPVWVRTLDAPTDEFRNMEGGEREPIEANPMLGYRGIRRDLQEESHFRLEIRAIKKLIEMGYSNLGVMLPLIIHPKEVRKAKQIMEEEGLDLERIEVGIMVETPASALIIEDLVKEGIDFVSFGTNDLTQYTLAVDRNNENVSFLYDETHPAVMKLIERVIRICKENGVKTSICGQAGSYPHVVEKLVKLGIDSVSANPDAVAIVRETVARIEKRLMLENVRNQ
jgi:pyruvate,water dikinase